MPRGVDDEERCETCGELAGESTETPCSDSFHRCRACKWIDGRLVARCRYHHKLHGGTMKPGDDPRGQD